MRPTSCGYGPDVGGERRSALSAHVGSELGYHVDGSVSAWAALRCAGGDSAQWHRQRRVGRPARAACQLSRGGSARWPRHGEGRAQLPGRRRMAVGSVPWGCEACGYRRAGSTYADRDPRQSEFGPRPRPWRPRLRRRRSSAVDRDGQVGGAWSASRATVKAIQERSSGRAPAASTASTRNWVGGSRSGFARQ